MAKYGSFNPRKWRQILDPQPEIDNSPLSAPAFSDAAGQPENLLNAWVDDHADALYRFALLRVRDKHAVEDLLQATFVAALGSSNRFRGDSSTRTWLVAILRLKIIDYYRRSKKDPTNHPAVETPDKSRQKKIKLRKWNCEPIDFGLLGTQALETRTLGACDP